MTNAVTQSRREKIFPAAHDTVSDIWNSTPRFFDPICYNVPDVCKWAHCAETVKNAANKKEVSKERTHKDRSAKTKLSNQKKSKRRKR